MADASAASDRRAATPGPRGRRLSIWVHAARPHTLPAAVAGRGVGPRRGARGRARRSASTRPSAASLVALLLQVVANFANDLSDFRRGADTPTARARCGSRRPGS